MASKRGFPIYDPEARSNQMPAVLDSVKRKKLSLSRALEHRAQFFIGFKALAINSVVFY